MKKKGFTLIELLAVIVILAIIALIAVPTVLDIIEDSRKSAVEESGRNIARAAETYYMQGVMKGDAPSNIDLTTNTLNYNGEKPEKGRLIYDETGRAHIRMYMNGYCVTVDYDNKVDSEKIDKNECILNKVILSINANGGEVSEASREYDSGDEIGDLPLATKEGYSFKGWTLTDGSVVTSTTKITENMTIIASWEAKTYTVTLSDGDNSTTDSTMVVTYNSAYGEIVEPTKTGYAFKGWKLDNGTDITNESIVEIAENHTLYAQWEKLIVDTTGMSLSMAASPYDRADGDLDGWYNVYMKIEGTINPELTSVTFKVYFKEEGTEDDAYTLIKTIEQTNVSEGFVFQFDYDTAEDCAAYDWFKVEAYDQYGNLMFTEAVDAQCFVAGTKVLTENGYVNIEELKVGDKVYSINLETNEKELKEVTRVIESSTKETYKMTIGTEIVEMSIKHELYIIDKGWVRAYNVKVGDKMLDSNGNEVEITNIEYTRYEEPIKTYNLTVDGNHNFFITNIQVLVHNSCSKMPE